MPLAFRHDTSHTQMHMRPHHLNENERHLRPKFSYL